MAKKVQYVSVAYRNTEKTYSYKAIIDKDGAITEPLEANDIVVCQVSAMYAQAAAPDAGVGFTIGVVVDDHMKPTATATRFIVQKVNVEESDRIIGIEADISAKQKRRDRIYKDLSEAVKQEELYDKLGAAVKGNTKAQSKLEELKKLDEELGNTQVEW